MTLNVLITGANSGFGFLTARTFARAGHTVHAGFRNPAKIARLKELGADGHHVHPVKLDVTEPGDIAAAVAAASAKAPIDVLVNNAGFAVSAPVEVLSDASLQSQFATNVLGPVRLIRAVVPAMRERRSGTVINVSSVVGQLAAPFDGAYAASKHALEALSESLWYELRPFGVRVVIVEPGAYGTQFGANVVTDPAFGASSPYRSLEERFSKAMAGMRMGAGQEPQEVADLIVAAASHPDPKLRYLAGADARMMVPMYRSQSFEGWAGAMLGQLGLGDVIKPPTA